MRRHVKIFAAVLMSGLLMGLSWFINKSETHPISKTPTVTAPSRAQDASQPSTPVTSADGQSAFSTFNELHAYLQASKPSRHGLILPDEKLSAALASNPALLEQSFEYIRKQSLQDSSTPREKAYYQLYHLLVYSHPAEVEQLTIEIIDELEAQRKTDSKTYSGLVGTLGQNAYDEARVVEFLLERSHSEAGLLGLIAYLRDRSSTNEELQRKAREALKDGIEASSNPELKEQANSVLNHIH